MNKNLSKVINDNKSELERLAASDEGKKVHEIMDGHPELGKAVQEGDVSKLGSVLSEIMATKEGASLVKSLSEMMNNRRG